MVREPTLPRWRSGAHSNRRGGVLGARRRLYLWSCDGAFLRRSAAASFATACGLTNSSADVLGLLTTSDLGAKELHRGILGGTEWVCRLRVPIELGKGRGVVLKVL